MILAGDAGGTKTILALFDETEGRLKLVRDETFRSASAGSLEKLLARFLDAAGRLPVRAAAFGVPGAVVDGRAKATNLPWQMARLGGRARRLRPPERAGGRAVGVPPVPGPAGPGARGELGGPLDLARQLVDRDLVPAELDQLGLQRFRGALRTARTARGQGDPAASLPLSRYPLER